MKILMITHSYYPDDPRVRREAHALLEANYQVDVLCLKDTGELRYQVINDTKIYRLPVRRHRGKGFMTYLVEYLLFFLYATIKTTSLFIKNRYRVIQVHTIPDFLVFCALVPRLLDSRIILDMHEVMPEFFSYRYGLKETHFLIRCLRLVERLSIAFAQEVITVSDTLKEILVARGVPASKITVVMNVADDKIFLIETAINRPSQSSLKNIFTMAYHGLLSDIYDLEVVLRSLRIVKENIPKIQLLIIGRGPREMDYKKLTRNLELDENVSFLGHVAQGRIPKVLARADLGIVPLKNVPFTHIAFPTKFVEYIALGIPVIIARRRTIERYFDNSCVTFFEPDDAKGLSDVILNLYRQPERCHQLTQNALQRYQAIAWPNKMKKRYHELVDKTVANI